MLQTIAVRTSLRRPLIRAGALLALLAALGTGRTHAADTASVPALSVAPPAAHWVERTLEYTYMGFTTQYSCDGLRDNVQAVLLALGARKKDLKIESVGCSYGFGKPEPFPGVSAHFSVLVPVTPDDVGKVGDSTAHATQWQTVDLLKRPGWRFEQGQCELLEQLKSKALPLFTTRNLKFRSSCTPHQVSLGDIQFSVDILRPAAARHDATQAGPAPAT